MSDQDLEDERARFSSVPRPRMSAEFRDRVLRSLHQGTPVRSRHQARVLTGAVALTAAAAVALIVVHPGAHSPTSVPLVQRPSASASHGGALVSAGAVVSPGKASPGNTYSGVAIIIPTMSGTVSSITGGTLHLTDVHYSLLPNMAKPSPDIPLPQGRWITPNHWQSVGDTLDIFRGESLTYFVQSKVIAPGASLKSFQGVVSAVAGDMVTFTTYTGAWAMPAHWAGPTGTMTVRMAPYSWSRTSGHPTSLRVGQEAIVGWFGDASHKIVWQMQLFPQTTIPQGQPVVHCPTQNGNIAVTPQELQAHPTAWLCSVYD